jgi:hypothetical protein
MRVSDRSRFEPGSNCCINVSRPSLRLGSPPNTASGLSASMRNVLARLARINAKSQLPRIAI